MESFKASSQKKFRLSPSLLEKMRDISTLFAFTIAGIILCSYEYKLEPSEIEEGALDYKSSTGEIWSALILIIGIAQGFTSFTLLIGFFLN